MAELVLTNVDDIVLGHLRERATRHGRSPADEAKVILSEAVGSRGQDAWSAVDMIFERLATSGQTFSDSADLLREDRDR